MTWAFKNFVQVIASPSLLLGPMLSNLVLERRIIEIRFFFPNVITSANWFDELMMKHSLQVFWVGSVSCWRVSNKQKLRILFCSPLIWFMVHAYRQKKNFLIFFLCFIKPLWYILHIMQLTVLKWSVVEHKRRWWELVMNCLMFSNKLFYRQ